MPHRPMPTPHSWKASLSLHVVRGGERQLEAHRGNVDGDVHDAVGARHGDVDAPVEQPDLRPVEDQRQGLLLG